MLILQIMAPLFAIIVVFGFFEIAYIKNGSLNIRWWAGSVYMLSALAILLYHVITKN